MGKGSEPEATLETVVVVVVVVVLEMFKYHFYFTVLVLQTKRVIFVSVLNCKYLC